MNSRSVWDEYPLQWQKKEVIDYVVSVAKQFTEKNEVCEILSAADINRSFIYFERESILVWRDIFSCASAHRSVQKLIEVIEATRAAKGLTKQESSLSLEDRILFLEAEVANLRNQVRELQGRRFL